MLRQKRCQAGVDLVETPMQDAQAFFLNEDALPKLVKAAKLEGDSSGIGTLAKGGFPLLFIVIRARSEKWCGIWGNGVVEIGLEPDTVSRVGFPFAEDKVDLLRHGFVVLKSNSVIRKVKDHMGRLAYRVQEPAPTIFCSVATDQ